MQSVMELPIQGDVIDTTFPEPMNDDRNGDSRSGDNNNTNGWVG